MINITQYLHQQAKEIFWHSPYDISEHTFQVMWKCHNWKNHIPESIEQIWPQLSEETRLVALIMAEEIADREEWE